MQHIAQVAVTETTFDGNRTIDRKAAIELALEWLISEERAFPASQVGAGGGPTERATP
jgi:hypothetical protein